METTLKNDFKRYNFKDKKEVLKVALDPANKIEFIRIIFPDILGRHMDFSIPNYELEKTFEEGKGFDGSSVEGFVRIEESDLNIVPDPATFRVLPWEYEGFQHGSFWREAIMFGDIYTPDGKHYEGDTRYILKRVLERGKKEFGIEGKTYGRRRILLQRETRRDSEGDSTPSQRDGDQVRV